MSSTLSLPNTQSISRDARMVMALLKNLQGGILELRLPNGDSHPFGTGAIRAVMQVQRDALFEKVLARGDIGLAEAYIDGDWDSPDLAQLLTLLADNRQNLRKAIYGRWHHLITARLRHWLNGNSRAGSKKNIMAHYDLGNDFYRLWLDPSMTYSGALFESDNNHDLEGAQEAKYRRVLHQLEALPGQSVLEIGCGWGGFAEVATREGLQVTGLSLSPAQLAWARDKVPQARLLLQDYRDNRQQFDHVVSIEMFEAVGQRWWPSYFKTVAQALPPSGKAVIQTITIRDDLFADYRRGTDFIQQYIFPGGMLPCGSAFREAAHQQGLKIVGEQAFGMCYARTLVLWRDAFDRQWQHIAKLGFDDTFRRLWRFYLSYCEAGFRSGNIDVVQFELKHQ